MAVANVSGTPKPKSDSSQGRAPAIALPPPVPPPPPPAGARTGEVPRPPAVDRALSQSSAAASLFELDAPGAAQGTPPAPVTPPTPANSLFEIDAPGAPLPSAGAQPAPALPASPAAAASGSRSTMEFLSDLEVPRESGQTIDFEVDAEIQAATGAGLEPGPETAAELSPPLAASAASLEADAFAAASAAEPAPAAPEAAATDEAQAAADAAVSAALPDLGLLRFEPSTGGQANVHRTVLRIAACRDSLRLMSSLGVQETERAAAARLLMGLDDIVKRSEGAPSVVKEPDAVLKSATPEQLTAIDSAVSAIEDKLLWLDESLTPDAFRARIESVKQPKKLLGRYARLLASRRFTAGQRRDRFEWIAQRLLVASDDEGMQHVLPPDRARSVLQYVLADLPRKPKADELAEAISYFEDALRRLSPIRSHEEFFEGGFYLDLHGYKVSMRELLVAPEFVYLSVLMSAAVHNRLERWIAERDRLLRANIAVDGSVRDEIERLLREQEAAVDDIFSVKRKSGLLSASLPQAATAAATDEAAAPKKAKRKARKSGYRFEMVVLDRQLVLQLLVMVAIIAAGTTVLYQTDVIGAPEIRTLTDPETAKLSPLVARALIKGSGDAAHLDGLIRQAQWSALDPRARQAAGDALAAQLNALGVKTGLVLDRKGQKIIEIRNGMATYVDGGKL
jgi:hypothetical protein